MTASIKLMEVKKQKVVRESAVQKARANVDRIMHDKESRFFVQDYSAWLQRKAKVYSYLDSQFGTENPH